MGRKEGLVHISQLSGKRVNSVSEAVKVGQKVKVKVLSVIANKISLSMKEVDQNTGADKFLQRMKYEEMQASKIDPLQKKEEKIFGLLGKDDIMKVNRSGKYGMLTGVPLMSETTTEEREKKRFREDSQEKWERKQAAYHTKQHLGMDKELLDLDDGVSEEEEVEIELRSKKTPFLEDTTTKAGVNLSPIRVVKNLEGSLQRQALNAIQQAKVTIRLHPLIPSTSSPPPLHQDRREIRIQQQNALIDSINKQELNKMNLDPTADSILVLENLRHLGSTNTNEIPEYKKEAMFKAALNNSHGGKPKPTMTIKEQKESLPIYTYKDQLMKACRDN